MLKLLLDQALSGFVVVIDPWCSIKVSDFLLRDFVRVSENFFVTEDRKQSNPAIIIGTIELLVIQGLGMSGVRAFRVLLHFH